MPHALAGGFFTTEPSGKPRTRIETELNETLNLISNDMVKPTGSSVISF